MLINSSSLSCRVCCFVFQSVSLFSVVTALVSLIFSQNVFYYSSLTWGVILPSTFFASVLVQLLRNKHNQKKTSQLKSFKLFSPSATQSLPKHKVRKNSPMNGQASHSLRLEGSKSESVTEKHQDFGEVFDPEKVRMIKRTYLSLPWVFKNYERDENGNSLSVNFYSQSEKRITLVQRQLTYGSMFFDLDISEGCSLKDHSSRTYFHDTRDMFHTCSLEELRKSPKYSLKNLLSRGVQTVLVEYNQLAFWEIIITEIDCKGKIVRLIPVNNWQKRVVILPPINLKQDILKEIILRSHEFNDSRTWRTWDFIPLTIFYQTDPATIVVEGQDTLSGKKMGFISTMHEGFQEQNEWWEFDNIKLNIAQFSQFRFIRYERDYLKYNHIEISEEGVVTKIQGYSFETVAFQETRDLLKHFFPQSNFLLPDLCSIVTDYILGQGIASHVIPSSTICPLPIASAPIPSFS